MRKPLLCFLCVIAALAAAWRTAPSAFSQNRSFDTLFPGLDEDWKTQVFSEGGLVNSSVRPKTLTVAPAQASGISLAGFLEERRPGYVVESLVVIPYPAHWGRAFAGQELLAVYNALSKVRGLEGRLYSSFTRGEDVPLFEEATRIVGPKKTSALPDPPAAFSVPSSETVYLRLKDANFGNSYYRADIVRSGPGLLYSLSNFRNLSYIFITVIKEDKFISRLYFEPLAEGILVYSIAGADVSDFVASRIDMPSAIHKRLMVIIGWVIDGIRASPPLSLGVWGAAQSGNRQHPTKTSSGP